MSSAVNKSSKRFAPNANRANVRGIAARSQQRRLSIVGQQSHAAAVAAASAAASKVASPIGTTTASPAPGPSPTLVPVQPLGPPPLNIPASVSAPVAPIRSSITIAPIQRPRGKSIVTPTKPESAFGDESESTTLPGATSNEHALQVRQSNTSEIGADASVTPKTTRSLPPPPPNTTPVRLRGLASKPSFGGSNRGFPGFKKPTIRAIDRPVREPNTSSVPETHQKTIPTRRSSELAPIELPSAKRLQVESGLETPPSSQSTPDNAVADVSSVDPPLSPRSQPTTLAPLPPPPTEREIRSSRRLRETPARTAAISRSRSEMLDDEPVSLRDSLSRLSFASSQQSSQRNYLANLRSLSAKNRNLHSSTSNDSLSISARLSNLRGGGVETDESPEVTGRKDTEVQAQDVRPARRTISKVTTVSDLSTATDSGRRLSVTDTLEFYDPLVSTASGFTAINGSGSRQRGRPRDFRLPITPPRPPSPPKKVERKDSKGRIILDPEDLPKYGRGYRKVEIEQSDEKVINVETFTMADLCKELPIGRKTAEFDEYEAARKKRKEARDRIRMLKKRAKRDNVPRTEIEELRVLDERRLEKLKEQQNKRLEEFRDPQSGPVAAPVLVMSATGDIAVDVQSTVVDRHGNANNDDVEREVESVDKYNELTNNSSFSVRERPERWDDDETHQFYQAISMWGTDFNLICHMFPGRTRRQIKTKFKLEERRNPAKLHLAIMRKLPIDLESYSNQIGTPLNTVAEIDRELKELRVKHEEILKKEADARAKAREEDNARAEQQERDRFGGKKVKHNLQESEEIIGEVGQVKSE